MNPNELTSQERAIVPHRGEMVQYPDGYVATEWNVPGDELSSSGFFAHPDEGTPRRSRSLEGFGGPGSVGIITTKSGNTYGFGEGLIIKGDTNAVYTSPEFPTIVIGDKYEIPGVLTTSAVRSVTIGRGNHPSVIAGIEQRAEDSPFQRLSATLQASRKEIDAQSNTAPESHKPRYEKDSIVGKNRELLSQSELGVPLLEMYDFILQRYPQLEDVTIVPLAENSNAVASVHSDWDETGQGKTTHEVRMPLGNVDDALKRFKEIDTYVPSLRDSLAELYGVQPDQITPELQYVSAFLHEFKHVIERQDAGSKQAWNKIKADDISELRKKDPFLGSLSEDLGPASNLNSPQGRDALEASLPALRAKYLNDGLTVDNLIDLRGRAHRKNPTEERCDVFAALVLRRHPNLLRVLTSPGDNPRQQLRERYRPVA